MTKLFKVTYRNSYGDDDNDENDSLLNCFQDGCPLGLFVVLPDCMRDDGHEI